MSKGSLERRNTGGLGRVAGPRLLRRVSLLVAVLGLSSMWVGAASAQTDDDVLHPRSTTTTLAPPTTIPVPDDGVVLSILFPVAAQNSYVNDWHFARDGGARLHEGIDIIAERHSTLVAVVDGVIATVRHSNEGRSGNMVVLSGDDGNTYYYIHLNNDDPGTENDANLAEYAFAPGIEQGARVEAGDAVGFVGDSGNAEGTSPHVHFAVDNQSAEAINPFWSLNAAGGEGKQTLVIAQLPATGPRGGDGILDAGMAIVMIGVALVGASLLLSRPLPENIPEGAGAPFVAVAAFQDVCRRAGEYQQSLQPPKFARFRASPAFERSLTPWRSRRR